ncbi:hypothetical protein B0H13DRAFT_1892376 [Mycena leptocephala]|nr:hypothetical protein B0H13DRAFT_1892376 [Mycena leptocephala]
MIRREARQYTVVLASIREPGVTRQELERRWTRWFVVKAGKNAALMWSERGFEEIPVLPPLKALHAWRHGIHGEAHSWHFRCCFLHAGPAVLATLSFQSMRRVESRKNEEDSVLAVQNREAKKNSQREPQPQNAAPTTPSAQNGGDGVHEGRPAREGDESIGRVLALCTRNMGEEGGG